MGGREEGERWEGKRGREVGGERGREMGERWEGERWERKEGERGGGSVEKRSKRGEKVEIFSCCCSVEQLFKEMASSEPVLKIAVSRGGQTLDLVETTDSHLEDWEQETDDPEADRHGSAAVSEEGEPHPSTYSLTLCLYSFFIISFASIGRWSSAHFSH